MILFTDFLRQIRKGAAVDEATAALADVVRAVDASNKPGEVTVRITVKPAKHGGSEKEIICAVASRPPRADIPSAVFFSNEDGDLLRSDPTQTEMPFQEAAKR